MRQKFLKRDKQRVTNLLYSIHWFVQDAVSLTILSTSYISSVVDLYHFDTDPDPGCEKIHYGSGSRVNFDMDTDLDPGKNNTDPDPTKKD